MNKFRERIQKKEERIRKMKPLFLSKGDVKYVKRYINDGDYKRFIYSFIRNMYSTFWEDGEFQFKGYRSIPDTYRLTLSYFPEVSLEDVIKYMVNGEFSCWFCHVPNRVVFGNYGNSMRSTSMNTKSHTGLNISMMDLRIAYGESGTYFYGNYVSHEELLKMREKIK